MKIICESTKMIKIQEKIDRYEIQEHDCNWKLNIKNK